MRRMKKAPVRQSVTIREAFQQFQRHNQVGNLAEDTIRYYDDKSKYLFAFIGNIDVPITTITPDVLDNYILSMKEQGNLSDATINNRLRMVRAFLYYCMERGWMPSYPVRMIRATDKQKEPYTQEELKRLLKRPNTNTCTFAEYRNWVMVNFLLATGCRAGTLVELKVQDVDLSAGMVFFRHMKARNQITVPLSQSMVKILQEYLTYRGGENEAPLFVSERGTGMTISTLENAIYSYNRSRGVDKTSIHLFRHTFAKMYIQAGGDPFRLQKLLGHSDLTMTRHYVALYADDLKANYDRLNPLEQFKREAGQGEKIKMKKSF